jgi:lysophospholipase L1-like esterase
MHYKNVRIAEFEDAAKQLAGQDGLPFVEVHSVMAARAGEGLQSHDGLHPNDAGHQLIFELVRPELDKLLNS